MDQSRGFGRLLTGLKALAGKLRPAKPPAMIGDPPSSRQVPLDPGLDAIDFSKRYAQEIDLAESQRMMEMGIPTSRIGMRDTAHGIRYAAFHPHGTEGGNNSPDGGLIVDSGLFNLDLLNADYGKKASSVFERSRLRDRLDAIIAHEYEEHRHGMSHVEALEHAPATELPISDRAREILRAMEKGWRGRREPPRQKE
jgi:hypothetical protein